MSKISVIFDKRFHRLHTEQPALLNRHYTGIYTFLSLIFIPFIILALLSTSLELRSGVTYGGPSSPLSTTVRVFVFIARRIQHFLPSSIRVELCLPTLLLIGSLSGSDPFVPQYCKSRQNLTEVGIKPKDPTLVVFEGFH